MEEQTKPWAILSKPIIDKCRLAAVLNMNASFNQDGSTALADLIEKMAAIIDDEIVARKESAMNTPELTPEMVRLVIAARVVAFTDQGRDALSELDKASEAFADQVPWDDETDTPAVTSNERKG